MSKFTPAPWSMGEPQIRGDYVMPGYVWINGSNWYALAQVCVLDGDVISETGLANARLIAAAPEMYELLRQCFEYLDCIPETSAGGDDEARALAATVLKLLDKIDGDSND